MDRNLLAAGSLITLGGSLSARRAWIEISWGRRHKVPLAVALRKESVDRNIFAQAVTNERAYVALRKESVDRNPEWRRGLFCWPWSLSARRAWIEIFTTRTRMPIGCGRSPQGERG